MPVSKCDAFEQKYHSLLSGMVLNSNSRTDSKYQTSLESGGGCAEGWWSRLVSATNLEVGLGGGRV